MKIVKKRYVEDKRNYWDMTIPGNHNFVLGDGTVVHNCGTGVGFSVERQFINKMPKVAERLRLSKTVIKVEDSKLGWANAYRELISMLYNGRIPQWDTSKVRKAGERLKTFGGRSSGPEPLEDLFQFTIDVFKEAEGHKLNSIQCHDLCCKIGEIVVVGGVRRCLPKGTLVHLKRGLVPIERVGVGDEVLSSYGEYKRVCASEFAGEMETILIKTQIGEFECSPEHRMAVLDSLDGDMRWVEAQFLSDDDFLLFPKEIILGSKTSMPEWDYEKPDNSTTCKDILIPELDAEMSWWIGNLHGDGYVFETNRETSDANGYVSIACAYDVPEQHSRSVDGFSRFGLVADEVERDSDRCTKPRVSSHQLASYLASNFKKSKTPLVVPDCVLQGTQEIRAAYIAGLFDSDGSKWNRPVLVVASVYEDFLKQVQTVLASIGIPSKLKMSRDKTKDDWQPLYHLVLNGMSQLSRFEDIVGPYSSKVRDGGLPKRYKEQNSFIAPKYLLRQHDNRKRFDSVYCSPNSCVNLSWWKYEKEVGEQWFVPIRVKEICETEGVKSCYDLQVEDTECFVANGLITHNSALISLSNPSDDRMRHAKSGNWWEGTPWRALANNSACYTERPDMEVFMREWLSLYESKSGERGFFNREAVTKWAEKSGRRDIDHEFGCNPCSEIVLRSCGLCNLSEVVVRTEDTLDTLKKKVELAVILGTMQATLTGFRYLREEWRKNAEEEALLGVSLTGIMDNELMAGKRGKKELVAVLDELREYAIEQNEIWAERLGINPAAAITCVKPSGTVSQLVDCASGIHPRYSPFYIRRVRADIKDPLATLMKDLGFPCEPDVTKPEHNLVFSFPMKAPEGALMTEEVPSLDHLDLWKTYQLHWCEHKPSITVHLREAEWMEAGAWVYRNFDIVSGISFLPYSGHTYQQAPYQEVTKEEYEELLTKIPGDVDWARLKNYEKEDSTVGAKEYACSGDNCEIVDLVKE